MQKVSKIHKKNETTGDFIRKTVGDRVFTVFNSIFFISFTLLCVFPFYYLFINTISDNRLVQAGAINLFPVGVHFQNYINMLGVSELWQSVWVTIGRTVLGTTFMVLASAFVGYLVTQHKMFARKIVYRFIVVTMFFNAGLIPWFLNMSMLGLTNNFWGYIIPGIVQPFNLILVKTYIESLPKEMEESMFVDGAGHFTIFLRLILPLSKPILATIAVFGAVGHWNSFIDSIILMGAEPSLFTLQHRLYLYLNHATNLSNLVGAGEGLTQAMIDQAMRGRTLSLTVSMVTIIPILLVYPFMQRYFQKGLMLGAVKG